MSSMQSSMMNLPAPPMLVRPRSAEDSRSKKQKTDDRTSQQIARDIVYEVTRMVECKELCTKDRTLHNLKWAEFKIKYRSLDISVKKTILNHANKQMETLVAREHPRRTQAKVWASRVQSNQNLCIDIFPISPLDFENGCYPTQCTINDFLKNVLAFESAEEFENLEKLLSDMSLFVSSMKLKYTSEFNALKLISEYFKEEIQTYNNVFTDGLFDGSELLFTTSVEDNETKSS